jgi:protocatechuate 3,4-dioxygenase beta subunit
LTPNPLLARDGLVLPFYRRPAAGVNPPLVTPAYRATALCAQRLITQMYFPGDPLFGLDPIFNSVPDPKARERMICRFDLALTRPEWALGFEWDIVLRGPEATVFERQEKRQ